MAKIIRNKSYLKNNYYTIHQCVANKRDVTLIDVIQDFDKDFNVKLKSEEVKEIFDIGVKEGLFFKKTIDGQIHYYI